MFMDIKFLQPSIHATAVSRTTGTGLHLICCRKKGRGRQGGDRWWNDDVRRYCSELIEPLDLKCRNGISLLSTKTFLFISPLECHNRNDLNIEPNIHNACRARSIPAIRADSHLRLGLPRIQFRLLVPLPGGGSKTSGCSRFWSYACSTVWHTG